MPPKTKSPRKLPNAPAQESKKEESKDKKSGSPRTKDWMNCIKTSDLDGVIELAKKSKTKYGKKFVVTLPYHKCKYQGWTLLMLAAKYNELEIVDHLINEVKVDINKTADEGEGALHAAAIGNSVDVAKRLLELKVDVDAVDQKKRTPLFFAARTGAADVVQLLLSHGAKVNYRNAMGLTPLLEAACYAEISAVEALLAGGADPAAIDRSKKGTVDLACSQLDLEAMTEKSFTVKNKANFVKALKKVSEEHKKSAAAKPPQNARSCQMDANCVIC